MMPFDYSTPPPATAMNLIPAKTIALVRMTVNAGNAGESGMLTHAKSGLCDMLAYSLVVIAGPHAKRKIHGQFIVESADSKYEDQIWRSRRVLKRILDSAFNLDPNDMSPEAKAKRTVGDEAFDGLMFYARIGIEAASVDWPAKNTLSGVVTLNESDWPGLVEQAWSEAHSLVSSPVSSTPTTRPRWADEE
jgi:hypothetical protein